MTKDMHTLKDYSDLILKVPEGAIFIGGKFISTERTHAVYGKADGAYIHATGYGSAADADAAVQLAAEAFPNWAATPPHERAATLNALADALEWRSDEFAVLEAHHAGKPIVDAEMDIRFCVQTLRWFASCAMHLEGRLLHGAGSQHRFVRREPVGVCSLLLPWNFPLLLMLSKVGAALACGNTVVVKPASETPLSALAFGALCEQVGLPPGVLNVVPGPGADVGMLLATHPLVSKVSFTGSNLVGQRVAEAASRNLKQITMELGGKSPSIVCDDADLDRAAAGVASMFGHAGQKCAARTRCIVLDTVADDLVDKLVTIAGRLRIGDPLDRGTTLGPVINKAAQEEILRYCRSAEKDGAKLVCGGKAPANIDGPFVEATIFDHANNGMKFAREEIFGPVLAVIRVSSVDEALAVANDSDFGLAASVYTRSLSSAHKLSAQLQAGTVSVNTPAVVNVETPFGGRKQSGFGREFGTEGLEAYLQSKSVIIDVD